MKLVKKIIKIKYLISFALIITVYFSQKHFLKQGENKVELLQKLAIKKRTTASKTILFNKGTSYKWNKPIKLDITILNRVVKSSGVELIVLGVVQSEMDLQGARVAWGLGKYTELLEGELSFENLNLEKNTTYSYRVKLLDVSGSNQKVYFSVQSQDGSLYHSVSMDTDQSLKIITQKKFKEQKKLEKQKKIQTQLTKTEKNSSVKKSIFIKTKKQPMY